VTDDIEDRTPDSADVALISAERLIFFSDAVVAIAITLLALNLPPVVGRTDTLVLSSLRANVNAYLPFLISFIVIGAHWRAHHRLYQYVERIDSRLISIDMVWLLMIIITPYATRVLSGNGGPGVRFSLYAIVQVISMVTFVAMRRHIRQAGLRRAGAPAHAAGVDDVSLLAAAATFAASIPIALATGGSDWTYVVWVGSVGVVRVVRRIRGGLPDS
jgi:uncharacterized membrane protein